MENFTPVAGLVGGMLIGGAAAIILFFLGRVAGISGIMGEMITGAFGQGAWRVAFIVGLVVGPLILMPFGVGTSDILLPQSWVLIVVAGILVGFGTRLGGGCTSGHGVCGLARFSKRSLVATVVFMGMAGITVFVMRHVIGG